MTIERTDPPRDADDVTSVLAFLDYHRDTLRLKAEGLDKDQLARTTAASSLTIAGLLKHLALVEHTWFAYRLLGRDEAEPWASVDWDADPDWELHTAVDDDPDDLRRMLDEAIEDSRRCTETALAEGGMDYRSARQNRAGEHFTLRYVLLHMIEEYARHNGHADFLREAIDGQTGV
ncbi:DinB family protein [Intrasporangium sp.]|uniref:DinB family protein n=1 Tax=Intrasporangium sp. TaxID=1925024 RepID=UPI00293B7D2C|nr:DinB family protein [Intrasporangium sp.]MDV3220219.1 DinB family protein [Intrasporangium sp.]